MTPMQTTAVRNHAELRHFIPRGFLRPYAPTPNGLETSETTCSMRLTVRSSPETAWSFVVSARETTRPSGASRAGFGGSEGWFTAAIVGGGTAGLTDGVIEGLREFAARAGMVLEAAGWAPEFSGGWSDMLGRLLHLSYTPFHLALMLYR